MSDTIAMSSDVLVEWREPFDAADGTFLGIDAVGSVTLKDSAGNAVTGASALSAAYVAGPPRRFQATIPYSITLTAAATYYIEFTLYAADGSPRGFRRWAVVAAYED